MKTDQESTSAPHQQYESDEFFHGDLRKATYLRRRALYRTQAEGTSPPPADEMSLGSAGAD